MVEIEIKDAPLKAYHDAPIRRATVEHVWEAIRGRDENKKCDAIEGRDRLVKKYLPLVHRLSRKFRNCPEPLEDLAQVGTIGLMRALENFDPSRGVRFETYAVPVILGEIKNHLRDHGWSFKVPRKVQAHRLAVQRAVDDISQMMGRSPTIPEIADATGLSKEEILDSMEVIIHNRPLSLDAERDANGNGEVVRLIDCVGGEDPQFTRTIDKMDLNNTMRCLGTREQVIIHLKFYRGLTQTEIATRLGISQMHVSRLQRVALSKLKQELLK